MKISLIAAVDENFLIGAKNKLPWYLPADLKHFKKLTTGHHIIMGRKTHDSIGKPLPERVNIVITRNKDYKSEGSIIINTIDEALRFAEKAGEQEVFVIGGEQIFSIALPLADRLYLTKIHNKFKGDIYFPSVDLKEWQLVSEEKYRKDGKNRYAYDFLVFEKKRKVTS